MSEPTRAETEAVVAALFAGPRSAVHTDRPVPVADVIARAVEAAIARHPCSYVQESLLDG